MPDTLITNIGELVYFSPSGEKLIREKNCALYVVDGLIRSFGSQDEVLSNVSGNPKEIDARGCLVTPSFVDCHTHLVFAGKRAYEFRRRIEGESYLEIAERGGGILSTVRSTREASEEQLVEIARRRLDGMLRCGTSVVEAKSGYGLTTEDELKMLSVTEKAGRDHPIEIIPTFLGAHAIPQEYKEDREGYGDLICDEMLPVVKEQGIAKYCDVFCDKGAFTVNEMERIFTRAKELGFELRAHLNEFENLDGVRVACELGAVSVDHLTKSDRDDAEAIKDADCVAVLLPGTTFFLGESEYADYRMFKGEGSRVAVASDFNPGSSMCYCLQSVAIVCAVYLGMTPEEILRAMTIEPAYSLGMADEFLWREGVPARVNIYDVETLEELIYPWGVNHVRGVVVGEEVLIK